MKIKVIIAGLTLLNIMSATAFANQLNLPTQINSETHNITISGALDESHGGIWINLFVRDSQNNLVVADQKLSEADGTYSFTFNGELALDTGGDFTYKTISQMGDVANSTFTYYKVSDFSEIVQSINDAANTTAINNLWGTEFNVKLLSSKNPKLKAMIDAGKTASINSLLYEIDNTPLVEGAVPPINNITVDNIATVIDRISLILDIEEASSATQIKNLLTTENIALLELQDDAVLTKALADTNRSYFETKLASSQKKYLKPQDLVDDIRDCYILTRCNYEKGTTSLQKIINDYPKAFDLTIYNSSGNNKTVVLSNISAAIENKTINTIADIQYILNCYVASTSTGDDEIIITPGSNSNNNKNNSNNDSVIPYPGVITNPSYNPSDVVTPNIIAFKDLGSYSWAEESINALVKLGVVNGVTNESYEPSRNVTRAELCKMVCGVFDIAPKTDGANKFGDVSSNDWYFGFVNALSNNNAVSGTTEKTFSPNVGITRQDVAVIVCRLLKGQGKADVELDENDVFEDQNEADKYASEAVSVLKKLGIVQGSNGKFNPKNQITRAEVAKLIYEVYKYINK